MKRIMERLIKAHIRLTNNQRGATMIEYALVVAGVAAAAAIIIGSTDGGGSGLMGGILGKVNEIISGL